METRNSPAALFTEEELANGEDQAWHIFIGFVSSFTLKAACQLRIPDILAAHGPLTLQEIASRLGSKSPNADYLRRLLRFLCAKGVFSLTMVDNSNGVPEPTYGLTPVSASLLLQHQTGFSLAPPALFMMGAEAQAPWQRLYSVLHGGVPFESCHGMDIWSFSKHNPDYNRIFNDLMARAAPFKMKTFLEHYRGFDNLETLVDVGGGTGLCASQIVTRYPHIKAINFDLPHVVAMAPSFPGVKHIGGDMFDSIPSADAILLTTVIHDWDDEHSIKILKNCSKALSESGKLIIVDGVLEIDEERTNPEKQREIASDLVMLVLSAGKERTKKEWGEVLAAAEFPRYTMTKLSFRSTYVIEAFRGASPR